jgi:hypothetical protein
MSVRTWVAAKQKTTGENNVKTQEISVEKNLNIRGRKILI